MRCATRSITFALGLAFAAAVAQAAGTVQVLFVQPEKFSDAEDARHDSSENLRELKRYLEAQAARYVGDGQTLTIEVLDVDLAGEIRFDRSRAEDVRVLLGKADWPRIKLRYSLESAGQPLRRVEQTVSDMAYLERQRHYADSEFLRHEKRMLDEWFVAQFGAAGAK
jgi:Protein of unknown function (DUF3016)